MFLIPHAFLFPRGTLTPPLLLEGAGGGSSPTAFFPRTGNDSEPSKPQGAKGGVLDSAEYFLVLVSGCHMAILRSVNLVHNPPKTRLYHGPVCLVAMEYSVSVPRLLRFCER